VGINTGALYIIFIMLVLFGFAYITSGPTPSQTPILTGPEVALTNRTNGSAKANLQLYKFDGVTITPPVSSLCVKGGANKHPEALIGFLPQQAYAVSTDGQIELWVSDSQPPYISPNEEINKSSGDVKTPGDRNATAPDGYRWEPQLYVFPQTVDKNGQPYYPSVVHGNYNTTLMEGVAYGSDNLPPNSLPLAKYTAEFVWNVKDIGLTDNDYQIQFVVHDGNKQLGVKCISIRVYTPPESENQQNKLP
jgi:hypothetical protein